MNGFLKKQKKKLKNPAQNNENSHCIDLWFMCFQPPWM